MTPNWPSSPAEPPDRPYVAPRPAYRTAEVTAMVDHDFVVQGLWSDGRVAETDGDDDFEKAVKKAQRMCASPLFEGTAVRVITRDGELEWMWESPKHGRPTFEKRPGGWMAISGLRACFKSDSGEDLLVFGSVNLPPVLSGPSCEYEALPTHVQVDDPNWHFPVLDRALSEKEEMAALEALFQEAVDRLMARN